MHRLTLAVATVAALAAIATPAHAQPGAPDVPSKIAVPAGNEVFLVGHASGVQIHRCAVAAGGGYAWAFVAPLAKLYKDNGEFLADHDAGPTWTTRDGSSVRGTRVDGVTVDPTAIPWLLLSATPTSPGRLAHTTFIQRVATTGGLAPTAPCTVDRLGEVVGVPYTADYVFWRNAEDAQ